MKYSKEISIIKLEYQHSRQLFLDVASLHIQQISHGVLSRMGADLLARIYREIACQPGSGLWVAMDQGKVAGFISGCKDTSATFRKVILRTSGWLTLFALGMLVRLRLLQFFRIMFYPMRKVSGSPHVFNFCTPVRAELLSVVVSADYQQLGLGKRLIGTFEENLRGWNVRGYYKVASDRSVPGSQQFYLRSGFQPCHTLTLNDTILQIYLKEITPIC